VRPIAEITTLLAQLRGGDASAGERLYAALYSELKRLARSHLARIGPITLDPTALIHEVWLRSRGQEPAQGRGQFFAHASVVMRSVIVDHVRARDAVKRGDGIDAVTLSTTLLDQTPAPLDVLQLDTALHALQRADERAHRVVEMRYFGGMTLEEIAAVIGLSVPTVKRDWRRARAFLFEQLRD
jgi:RNA polymerase sigma factor (TIGR02999 family)